jgi:uncharacterized membrane protein YwzB
MTIDVIVVELMTLAVAWIAAQQIKNEASA